MKKVWNYFRSSSASICFILNPFGWTFIPNFYVDVDAWDDKTYTFRFLFLSVCVFICDGDW